ncbi:aldo/keto reductase [Saxibacter everestensis]|uniref:Aldo/keto reductase n=1 Tax=Saxibacter everestensis TaxID=2909229 RepID=A0ABY8QRD7_9MICO|nr:aldo/keto reductase [Brevibacteriaceae bacterium ZFBP1038]
MTVGRIEVPGVEIPLSTLVLGTMTFGDTLEASQAEGMFEAAIEAGITGIDTANGYAAGRAEGILAPLVARHRDSIVLATKAGMPHPDAGDSSPLSAAGLRSSVEGSLRRLGVETIDLFYLHQPDRLAPLEETLATVRDLVGEGKIKALGVSNFAAWQIADVIRVAEQVGAPRPVVAQQLYNLVARRLDEEYAEFARNHDVLTIVYNPLGGGLLTGRHAFENAPETGRFGDSKLAEMYRQRYWNQQLFDAIAQLSVIASGAGVSLVELSLRWLAGSSVPDAILLGGSKTTQLMDNIEAVGRGPLPADVVAACDEVGAALRGPMPAYNR